MIRRAVSRSRPVRPASNPLRPTAAELLRERIAVQVERLREAAAWNDRLVDEFDEAVSEVEVIRFALKDETFPHEALHATLSELKEEIPSLLEKNERLQERVCELKLVVTSLRGLVTGSLSEERFQILEDASASIAECMDWLQRVVAELSVEFETRMISSHIPISPAKPSVESPVESPAIQSPVEIPADSPVELPGIEAPVELPVGPAETWSPDEFLAVDPEIPQPVSPAASDSPAESPAAPSIGAHLECPAASRVKSCNDSHDDFLAVDPE